LSSKDIELDSHRRHLRDNCFFSETIGKYVTIRTGISYWLWIQALTILHTKSKVPLVRLSGNIFQGVLYIIHSMRVPWLAGLLAFICALLPFFDLGVRAVTLLRLILDTGRHIA